MSASPTRNARLPPQIGEIQSQVTPSKTLQTPEQKGGSQEKVPQKNEKSSPETPLPPLASLFGPPQSPMQPQTSKPAIVTASLQLPYTAPTESTAAVDISQATVEAKAKLPSPTRKRQEKLSEIPPHSQTVTLNGTSQDSLSQETPEQTLSSTPSSELTIQSAAVQDKVTLPQSKTHPTDTIEQSSRIAVRPGGRADLERGAPSTAVASRDPHDFGVSSTAHASREHEGLSTEAREAGGAERQGNTNAKGKGQENTADVVAEAIKAATAASGGPGKPFHAQAVFMP